MNKHHINGRWWLAWLVERSKEDVLKHYVILLEAFQFIESGKLDHKLGGEGFQVERDYDQSLYWTNEDNRYIDFISLFCLFFNLSSYLLVCFWLSQFCSGLFSVYTVYAMENKKDQPRIYLLIWLPVLGHLWSYMDYNVFLINYHSLLPYSFSF